MLTFRLQEDDSAALSQLADDLAVRYDSVESAAFQRESRVYAEELPRRVRRALNDFRLTESSGALLLTGLPLRDDELGPTPDRPGGQTAPAPTLRHDLAFFLIASLLGDPIGWATQQDGQIMHDVFPVRGLEREQIGWGSEETLTWHTEDAFHPLRTDYLGLMCLRNPDRVQTTFADIADVQLDAGLREALSQPRFVILPDDSHRRERTRDGAAADDRVAELTRRGLARVERALAEPDPVAVLFGDPRDPYLRIDPHYMAGAQGEAEQRVLDSASAAIDAVLTGAVLEPGDVLFVDNYRMVHGRKPFRARFDGTDRWLRRLNVTRDLRRSRDSRVSADSRVIY